MGYDWFLHKMFRALPLDYFLHESECHVLNRLMSSARPPSTPPFGPTKEDFRDIKLLSEEDDLSSTRVIAVTAALRLKTTRFFMDRFTEGSIRRVGIFRLLWESSDPVTESPAMADLWRPSTEKIL